MKRHILYFTSIIILIISIISPVSQAIDPGEQEKRNKAKTIFDKTITLIEKEGLHKAFYELNTNRSEFVDGAIHVMIVTDGGVIFAHSHQPHLIGLSIAEQISATADPREQYSFRDALTDMDKVGDKVRSIHWVWFNPETKKRERKRAFVKRIYDPDADYLAFFYVMASYFMPLDER